MSSREEILEAVLKHQPEAALLPDLSVFKPVEQNLVSKYTEVFQNVGGTAYLVEGLEEILALLRDKIDFKNRVITNLDEFKEVAEFVQADGNPHSFQDVELAIIKAHFAVAENGGVWITEELMSHRAIPYICQHLAVLVNEDDVVTTLHEAYEKIGQTDYGFGGFIAGPSKTADIEQALVLGAHGPLSMSVFIMKQAI